ncbi:hypothetical protein F5I97DRAFT_1816987 [Phlebopus sp. FC_14]|nr:hypothetical protein F5I97DRAFT_1816987 [Phlebopus sp. FC_14]
MSKYLRRLVSGGKARFKDDKLDLELDLAYVTDQIIVMGFPATGLESIYRNRRTDVQQFLSSRHGSDFWVFNFCPVTENTYDESIFQGRVSRYPFPDHHVPPFSILPLVTREMGAWLSGSESRVAVLHCKAGKGRSGTLACAYLLSYFVPPSSSCIRPIQENDEWAILDVKEYSQSVSSQSMRRESLATRMSMPRSISDSGLERVAITTSNHESAASSCISSASPTLEQVLDLHSSRRMKSSGNQSKATSSTRKRKMGVSIPSQRRWLLYWSQVLSGEQPTPFRRVPLDGNRSMSHVEPPPQKIRITKLIVRIRGLSGIQPRLVQAATTVMNSASKRRDGCSPSSQEIWASFSRYNDTLVNELERWEQLSRNPPGIYELTRTSNPFQSGDWDKSKMVRSFAHMAAGDVQILQEDGSVIYSHTLSSLRDEEWVLLLGTMDLPQQENSRGTLPLDGSAYSFTSGRDEEPHGISVEANRELCVKLYMGRMILGWLWFIPAFHISPESSSSSVILTRDEIDFAIGLGKALIDVELSLVRCSA